MSETDLVSSVLDALALDPTVYAWRNNTGAYRRGKNFIRYGKKGSADIFVIVKHSGRFVALEAKVDNNQPEPEQREFAANVRRVGGYYGVVRDVNDARNHVIAAKMGVR